MRAGPPFLDLPVRTGSAAQALAGGPEAGRRQAKPVEQEQDRERDEDEGGDGRGQEGEGGTRGGVRTRAWVSARDRRVVVFVGTRWSSTSERSLVASLPGLLLASEAAPPGARAPGSVRRAANVRRRCPTACTSSLRRRPRSTSSGRATSRPTRRGSLRATSTSRCVTRAAASLRRRLMIGTTDGGRALTLVIERTIEPTTWLIVTGWSSTDAERNLLGRWR